VDLNGTAGRLIDVGVVLGLDLDISGLVVSSNNTIHFVDALHDLFIFCRICKWVKAWKADGSQPWIPSYEDNGSQPLFA
jgi:hypothetical protein